MNGAPDKPVSPCTNRCMMDSESGLCTGCYRTGDEIAEWSLMDGDERLEVLRLCTERRAGQAAAR